MSYAIKFDGPYSNLYESSIEPNDVTHFATFGEAKAELLNYLTEQKSYWQEAITQTRLLTKGEVKFGR